MRKRSKNQLYKCQNEWISHFLGDMNLLGEMRIILQKPRVSLSISF